MTIREYLGDEKIAQLENMGFLPSAIKKMAIEQGRNERKNERTRLSGLGLEGDVVQKIMRGELSEEEALRAQRFGANPTLKEWGEDGATTVTSLANFAERAYDVLNPFYEGEKDEKGNYIYKNIINEKLTPKIREWKKDREAWDKINPDKWNVAGNLLGLGAQIAGDPINYIPFSSGANLGRKLLYYAATGAASNSIYGMGVDENKDYAKDALIGAGGGVVLGGAFELAARGLSKIFVRKNEQLAEQGKEPLSQNEIDEALSGLGGERILAPKQQDFLNTLSQKDIITLQNTRDIQNFSQAKMGAEELNFYQSKIVQNIQKAKEQSAMAYFQIQKEMANLKPTDNPRLAIDSINAKFKPTPEQVSYTMAINDGAVTENRYMGENILYALDNAIKNPVLTPDEIYVNLKNGGFNDEFAGVLTRAYEARDSQIARDYVDEKLDEKALQELADIVRERAKTSYNNENLPQRIENVADTAARTGDNGYERAGDSGLSGGTATEKTGNGAGNNGMDAGGGESLEEPYQTRERGGYGGFETDALRFARQDTLRASEGGRLSAQSDKMGGYQAAGSYGDDVSRFNGNEVVGQQAKAGDENDARRSATDVLNTSLIKQKQVSINENVDVLNKNREAFLAQNKETIEKIKQELFKNKPLPKIAHVMYNHHSQEGDIAIRDFSYGINKDNADSFIAGVLDVMQAVKEGRISGVSMGDARRALEQDLKIEPIKEFGKNYTEFYHDGKGAVKKILAEKQGQVAGAFYRDDLGDITLPWGEAGSGKSDGWGLAKIAKYHPEVLENLDELVRTLPLKKETQGRYQLENENYKIGIRKDFEGKSENWILTAFEKDSAFANRTDFNKSPVKDSSKTTELSDKSIIPQTEPKGEVSLKNEQEIVKNLGLDGEILNKIMQDPPKNTAELTARGTYEKLKQSADRVKAKEFFEGKLGKELKPFEVSIQLDKLLREYILKTNKDKPSETIEAVHKLADENKAIFDDEMAPNESLSEQIITKDGTQYHINDKNNNNMTLAELDDKELYTLTKQSLSLDNVADEAKKLSGKEIRELLSSQNFNPNENYSLQNKAPVVLTKAQRKEINAQAEQIIKKPLEEITAEDREVLRLYTGKGGIESGTKGSLTQHYTPYPVINAMFEAVENAGIKIKTALEPAEGAGNFIGMRPNLKWDGVDIDEISYEVAKRLYPQANHYHAGFEDFKKKDYDLVISNVPFLETRGAGELKDRGDIKALHDYFFIKGVDSAKDDGIVAFITSKSTADKADKRIRAELMQKADVIGMYRLADKSFAKNAHTDVGADIIFLQKRAEGVEPSKTQLKDNEAFINSTKTSDDIYLNDYYKLHPQNILGDMQVGVNKAYGTKSYVVSGESDLSMITINPRKADDKTANLDASEQKIPTSKPEFEHYAKENGLEYWDKSSKNIRIDGDKIKQASDEIDFDDVSGGAKIYEDISGTPLGKKIALLNKIKNASENGADADDIAKMVQQYKKEFKTHPYSDKALGKAFRDQNDVYYDLGSFFNKDFTAAGIVSEKTRYENMGRLEVDSKSPLKFRLHAAMDNKGRVRLGEQNRLAKPQDFEEAVKDGYSISGEDKELTNDVLYYAGNIQDKLDKLEGLRNFYKDDDVALAKLDAQEERLNKVLPPRKDISAIKFDGMEAWLRDNGVSLYEIEKKVRHNKDGSARTEIVAYGMSGEFNNYINKKALITRGQNDSDAVYKRKLKNAQQKLKTELARVKEMAMQNPEISNKIEQIYNKLFNSYVQPDYKNARFLVQDAINEAREGFKFRDNQIAWAAKAMYEGKGVNSHDVGGGKTAAAILLARALKVRGVSKKPLFVVPSKVINNWEKEIRNIYPDSKIFNLFNLPENRRLKMLTQLGNEQADYVLISHEAFEKLKMPTEKVRQYLNEMLHENVYNAEATGRAAALNDEKMDKIVAAFENTQGSAKLSIDRLGIDAIFIDEARAFKNIGYGSKISRDGIAASVTFNIKKGATPKDDIVTLGSARAYDAAFKARFIAERNNGNNIFMLDATLTPNKPMELYTALTMLDRKILHEYQIYKPDEFANRYFQVGAVTTSDGGYKRGLVGLNNVFELDGIMSRYIDQIPMEEFAGRGIKIPKENIKMHYLKASDDSAATFDHILSRFDEAKTDPEKKKEIMGIYADAVNASADPRLYAPLGLDELTDALPTNNKIAAVVDMAAKKRTQNKDAGQIIFLDNAGHSRVKEGALKQNLHQETKEKLIKSGRYKAGEIAIISGEEATNVKTGKEQKMSGEGLMKAKQDIVDAYNDGKIKVVIGTTKSAGEGLNIQKYTTDIYHLNLPWTPGEIKQRNGRGIRFGNINDEVNIHYLFQEGTFDQKMYEVVSNKRGWNEALWSKNKSDTMAVLGDEGAAMPSIEEMAIIMERDPVKKEVLKKELEYNKMQSRQEQMLDDMAAVKTSKKAVEIRMSEISADLKTLTQKIADKTPNSELRALSERILKQKDRAKRAELQAKYDEKEALLVKTYEKFRIGKEKALAEAKSKISILDENELTIKQELDALNEKIAKFEAQNLDENGKIREMEAAC